MMIRPHRLLATTLTFVLAITAFTATKVQAAPATVAGVAVANDARAAVGDRPSPGHPLAPGRGTDEPPADSGKATGADEA